MSIAVAQVFISNGHQVWRTPKLPDDDSLTVYADNKDAGVVSHDAAFARRRQEKTIRQHIRLKCEQPDGVIVLTDAWDELEPLLLANPEGVFIVSRASVEFKPPRWI